MCEGVICVCVCMCVCVCVCVYRWKVGGYGRYNYLIEGRTGYPKGSGSGRTNRLWEFHELDESVGNNTSLACISHF